MSSLSTRFYSYPLRIRLTKTITVRSRFSIAFAWWSWLARANRASSRPIWRPVRRRVTRSSQSKRFGTLFRLMTVCSSSSARMPSQRSPAGSVGMTWWRASISSWSQGLAINTTPPSKPMCTGSTRWRCPSPHRRSAGNWKTESSHQTCLRLC